MATVPNPAAMWEESPSSGAAGTLTRLVPYKTTAGYWVFLPLGSGPAGSTQGAVTASGSGYDILTTSTTIGKRITRSVAGPLLFY